MQILDFLETNEQALDIFKVISKLFVDYMVRAGKSHQTTIYRLKNHSFKN